MIVYKRAAASFLKGIITAPFIAAVFALISKYYLDNFGAAIVAAAVFLLLSLTALLTENVRFELDETEFRHYRGFKLKGTYQYNQVVIGNSIRKYRRILRDHDIKLVVNLENAGQKLQIEASAIGSKQFYKMYAQLEERCLNKPDGK